MLGHGKDLARQLPLGQVEVPALLPLPVLRPLATAACFGALGQVDR